MTASDESGDEETGALLSSPPALDVAATVEEAPSALPRFPPRCKRCLVCGLSFAAASLLAVFLLPLVAKYGANMFYNKAVMHYTWKQAIENNPKPLCYSDEFTALIEKNLAETCSRLNRVAADYWLDKGTLLAVIREPGQGIFKHDDDADIVYMSRDHAKVVGALKNGGAGEFWRQFDEDYGPFGIHNPPIRTHMDLDVAAFTEEKSARTEFGRKSLAINGDVAFYMPRIVFPLRKLGGKGKLAHCNIPNIPFAFYKSRDWSMGQGPRMVQDFLGVEDLDLRPCTPRTAAENAKFLRLDSFEVNPKQEARSDEEVMDFKKTGYWTEGRKQIAAKAAIDAAATNG